MEGAFFEFWMKVAKAHLTKLITSLGAILVYRGVIEESDKTEFIAGAITFAISSAISFWRAYGDTIKTAVAAWLPRGATMEEVKREIANKATPTPKLLSVLLIMALGASMTVACGKRYAPGTPTQSKLAYELEKGLGIIEDTQVKLMAAVNSGATTLAIADRFLIPARDIATLAKTRIIPSLKAYDAAITAGDLNAQKLLTAELTPLVREFNRLSGLAFGASLPDNVVGSLGKLLQQLQTTIRTVLQEFTPEALPAPAAS